MDDEQFKQNLTKLGNFEFYDDFTDQIITFKYWTNTRWQIRKFRKKKYIFSPAFWNDTEIEARFALNYRKVFKIF